MVLRSVSNAPLRTMQGSKNNHGSNPSNTSSSTNNNESHIRPTEAQLRWAQFHHRTRARAVKEQVDRLWQTPALVKDVEGALSDDGTSTCSEASDASTKSAIARIKSRRPKISRGRRAVLKVSQRSYHQRSGLITKHGFQCVGDKENNKKDDLAVTPNRPRRSTGALPKDEDRINRFEAAYAIMRNNVKPTSKPTIVRSTRRWTRPKNEDGSPASGTTNFQDWKWGIARRKRTANNKMNRALPFDRRASWLIHMPARESNIKRRYQYAQPLSSNGEYLQPITLYEGASAEILSPGQLKFDEMVSRLQEYDEAPIPEQDIVAVSARYLDQLPRSEPIESPRVVRRHRLYDFSPEEEEDEPLRVVRRPKNSIGTRYEQELLQQHGDEDEEPMQIVRRSRDGTASGARYEQEYLQGQGADDDQDEALRRRARVSTGARYDQSRQGKSSMDTSQRSRGSIGIGASYEREHLQQHGEEDEEEESVQFMRRARGTGSGARYEEEYLQQHGDDEEESLRIVRRARCTGSGARYEQEQIRHKDDKEGYDEEYYDEEYIQKNCEEQEERVRVVRRARGTGIGAQFEKEHCRQYAEEDAESLRIVRRAGGSGIGAQFEQEHLHQYTEEEAESLRIMRRARTSSIGAQYEHGHLRHQDDEEGYEDKCEELQTGGGEAESLRVVRRAHGAGIEARHERDHLEQQGKVDEESLPVVRRARGNSSSGARYEQEKLQLQDDEDEESLRIERRARGSIGDNYEQYLAQQKRRGRVSEANSMGAQSMGSVESDFFEKARRMHDTTPLDSSRRVSRNISLGAIPESSDKQAPYSPMRTSVRGNASPSTIKDQHAVHRGDHDGDFYKEDDSNLSHIYSDQEFDEKSKSAFSDSGLVSTKAHMHLDDSSPETPRSHVQSTTFHAYSATVSPRTPRTKSREGGALLDGATPTSDCGEIDGAGVIVDRGSEISKSSSFRMGAAKVAGGFFQRVTGLALASSDTGSEIRAVAAFRKTQKERGNVNDGSSSTSSFRILPDGIRRLVLGEASPKTDTQQAIDEKSESYSPLAKGQSPGLEDFNPSKHSTDLMSPAYSFSNRSAGGASAMSPEHGKSLRQKIMEESGFLGDDNAEQSIIDTDGTTSDASGAKMDAAMAASLLLSPTILTKRHQQAIKSIERRSWEQVGYLLSANPWLAEMMEVTTYQYLLHKLALYGASKFLWSDENDAVDVVNAAPQALNQDIVDRFPSSVHKFDQDGNLPLHMAAASGNIEMAILLGERFPSGASVRNNDGMLPLHLAVQACAAPLANAHGDLVYGADFVALILQLFPGAVAVSDSEGDLPLHIAAAALEGDIGVDIIYLLLDEADRQAHKDGGLRFIGNVQSKTDEDSVDDATIDTEAPTDSSNMDDDAMRCNMVRNEMGRTALTKAIEAGSGWQIIEAIARGPGGVRAALLPDASKCNALHLLLSEEYGDPQAALSILKIAPESATARNADRMLPIEIACRTEMPEEVILAMVLVDTPVDLNKKDVIKAKGGFGGSWYFLTCESDDEYVHLVEEVISICSYAHLMELCYMKGSQNESGAPVISRATPMCRATLEEALQMGETAANAADQLYSF